MCIKKFHFERIEDASNVSGTGVVAEGIIFSDTGEVVLHWMGKHSSTNLYRSIEDVEYIHGHCGKTKIVFDD
jgi:hypothetical protein